MKALDMETYKRRAHFDYFRSLAYPYVGVTQDVDVTELLFACREKKKSFYLAFLHAAVLAAEQVPELRQRIHDGGIVEYEECPSSHVELLEDGTYCYCTLRHHMDAETYFTLAAKKREECRRGASLAEDENVESEIFISALPWMKYSALLQPVAGGDESNPRITWGKYEQDPEGRTKMPVSLLANHALVDGVHLSAFYTALDGQMAALTRELTGSETPSRARRRRERVFAIPFFCVLALVTVMAWLLPLRPTESVEEKRKLASFPALTGETLLNGDFFDGLNVWFSDTFTFRDRWIGAAERIHDLRGYGNMTVVSTASAPTAEEQPETPAPVPVAVTPAAPEGEEISDSTPAELPEEDQGWQGNVLENGDFAVGSSILTIADSGYWLPAYNGQHEERFVSALNALVGKLPENVKLYTVLVPSNITCMYSREDRDYMKLLPEEDYLAGTLEKLDANIENVDVFGALVRHNNEYICFRTDHHWTALGAYYAYEQWCRQSGREPVPLSEYTEFSYDGYLGTAYASGGKPKKMRENPDTVVGYTPPGNIELYIQNGSADAPGEAAPLHKDMNGQPTDFLFATFMGGDHPKATFVNRDITDGSACLIVKNSMGNMLAYYYTQHYQYVYVVDVRHYFAMTLTRFAEKYEVDDVIFAFNAGYVWGNGGSKLIAQFAQ